MDNPMRLTKPAPGAVSGMAVRELSARNEATLRQELQFILRAVLEIPADELPGLLGEIEEVRYTALARLTTPNQSHSTEPDQLLSIAEAAQRLNVSQDYLYRHGKQLPFTRRMGRRL